MGRPQTYIWVSTELEATPEEVEAVRSVFASFGLSAEVRPSLLRLSEGPHPWYLLISVPLAAPFIAGFATAAGQDAWRTFKTCIADLYEARRGHGKPDGVIKLDADQGRTFELPDGLPDEAYRALVTDDFDDHSMYVWDASKQGWRRVGPPSDS